MGTYARLNRRLADGVFFLLLTIILLLAGWLSARWERVWDWTTSARNTLHPATLDLIATLDQPVQITLFMNRHQSQARWIESLLARYRAAGLRLVSRYVDPQIAPDQARAAGISQPGQALIAYGNRREVLNQLNESSLTAALARLSRRRKPWIVFLEGHGERRLEGAAPGDLSRFAQHLREQGYRLQTLDLLEQQQIPDNTDLLVLSMPFISLFPGEAEQLIEYVKAGGNLLWFMDPGPLNGLEPLADFLGIHPLPGILVDANVRRLNIEDPSIALIPADSDPHWTQGLGPVLLPGTRAYRPLADPRWEVETPLKTLENSWNETGPIQGVVRRDAEKGEEPGPLAVALFLHRPRDRGEQRLVLLGDGDFLSNASLSQGGNGTLGLRLVRWLTTPEGAEIAPRKAVEDRALQLTDTARIFLGIGALVVLPLLFASLGLLIRWRRRRIP